MPSNAEILAPVGQISLRLMESCGIEPAGVLRAAGLDAHSFDAPHQRIARTKSDALVRALIARIPDPAFGLRAAQCWHPSHLGVLGYAWMSSSSLRSALARLARYWRTIASDVEVALHELPAEVALSHKPPPLPEDLDRVRGDVAMAILHGMCRSSYGERFVPQRVAFRHAAPSDRRPYETLFGCPLSFGAEANRLVLSRELADHALPTANRQLAAMHDRILAEELARLAKGDVLARARASLLERLTSGALSEEDLAGDLHMSRRSLQRRLAEADASYQVLLDDTRKDLALRYLEDPAKSATDVTFLLGYSQQSAFTRAFRRWTGMSPSAYRERRSARAS